MMTSVRDRFAQGAKRRRYLDVSLPHLGEVTIQSWSEAQRCDYEALIFSQTEERSAENLKALKGFLIISSVVDHETKEAVFTEADIDFLLENDSQDIDALMDACQQHCVPVDTRKELKKTSEETAEDNSPSGSPDNAEQ